MSNHGLLILCALHSFAFAIFHLAFWRLFNWPASLAHAGIATRAITQILNLRLTYVFLAIGALCLAFPDELVGTPMGRAILAGASLFWVGRTIEQWLFLPFNRPVIHFFTASFVAGAVLFALPLFR